MICDETSSSREELMWTLGTIYINDYRALEFHEIDQQSSELNSAFHQYFALKQTPKIHNKLSLRHDLRVLLALMHSLMIHLAALVILHVMISKEQENFDSSKEHL